MSEHSLDVLTDAHGHWVPVGGILRWRGEHLAPPPGCGTEHGYYLHRKRAEKPCDRCKSAHNTANVRRAQRRGTAA